MGCCPSTLYNSTQGRPYDRYPPPMAPQEEVKVTVKEVLIETQPTPSPSKSAAFDNADHVKDQSSRQPKKLEFDRDSKSPSSLPLPLPTKDRGSQVCSRSDRFVSTVNYNSSIGARLRTPASKSDGRRSNDSRSPAKRPDARMPSPGSLGTPARRNVRRLPDQSPGRKAPTRVVGGPKADLGEKSGRRSRSPAKRVGQIDSGRRTDPSPGRSRRLIPKGEELIENPPVSLECFIFL